MNHLLSQRNVCCVSQQAQHCWCSGTGPITVSRGETFRLWHKANCYQINSAEKRQLNLAVGWNRGRELPIDMGKKGGNDSSGLGFRFRISAAQLFNRWTKCKCRWREMHMQYSDFYILFADEYCFYFKLHMWKAPWTFHSTISLKILTCTNLELQHKFSDQGCWKVSDAEFL